MHNLHEIVVSVVAFVVLLGIMVIVHEFGHFAVAKLCGVRVEAFSVGFGPRLFGVKYGDTDYKICALPLGGYVKMTGETPDGISTSTPGTPVVGQMWEKAAGQNPDVASSDPYVDRPANDPGAFTSHPRWQRMLIGLAGPVANFILAFVAMTIYYNWFNEVPNFKNITIEWVEHGSAGARAGLEPGDIIREYADVSNPSWDQIEIRTNHFLGQTVPITIQRGAQSIATHIELPAPARGKDPDLDDAGIYLHLYESPIIVQQVAEGTPAEQAGLKDGDLITSVDGHAFHTILPLLSYLQSGQGAPVTLAVQRNGVALPPIVVHPSIRDGGWKLGFAPGMPADPPMHQEPLPFYLAMHKSRSFCVENSTVILDALGRILTRKVSISQLSGPVGIARMAGQAAETKGYFPKFGLSAAISLNLGILNLLPFPILDGGMILLLIIESGIRRDINTLVKERIYQAAFVMLVAFFAFIIFNDVTKLRH